MKRGSRKWLTAAAVTALAVSVPLIPSAQAVPGHTAAGQAGDTSGADGPTAAAAHGWQGDLVREDGFDGTALGDDWSAYDGEGHAGNGVRSPDQIEVGDGVLRIEGTPDGTTGGAAWNPGQKYGRWETRAKYAAGTAAYHQVLILWPDAEDFPVGGEVDYSEVSDAKRQNLDFFLHYGQDNSQVSGHRQLDMTEWHNYAVEWTPDHVVGYVDGEEFFRSDDPKTLPPREMHPTVQLDWFPQDGEAGEGAMEVDWIRQYGL